MREQYKMRPSTVWEKILFSNYLRMELIKTLDLYSEYSSTLKKTFRKQYFFPGNIESARADFQRFLSVSYSLLEDWGNHIVEARNTTIIFVQEDSIIHLIDEYLLLHKDFSELRERFEQISYECMDSLGENEDIESYLLPSYKECSLCTPTAHSESKSDCTSIWQETAFFIMRVKKLEKGLCDIICLLEDLELELLTNNSRNPSLSRKTFHILCAEAVLAFNRLEEAHKQLDKRLEPYLDSVIIESDKEAKKFKTNFEELMEPDYWALKLRAIEYSCKVLLNSTEKTKKASDF